MGCLPLLIWWTLALHVYRQFRCSLVCILTLPRLQFWKFKLMYLQFIVVSLKEGMFNNANVIFRTKFVDGVSTVTRTVPSKQRWPVYYSHASSVGMFWSWDLAYNSKAVIYLSYCNYIIYSVNFARRMISSKLNPHLLLDCQMFAAP